MLVIPSDSTATITGETPAGAAGGGRGAVVAEDAALTLPRNIARASVRKVSNAIRGFVPEGGNLVTLNGATAFPVDRLGIGVRNVLTGKTSKEFWAPGSTLKVTFEQREPDRLRMPSRGLALYLDSPAFEITAQDSQNYDAVVRYEDRDLLESGWLVGEDNLTRRAAVVSAKSGEGRVILIGFPAQHGAQMHGTYKLLFNALVR